MNYILNNSILNDLDSSIETPKYDRKTLKPSLVHIGLGNFHRAHYLTYLDKLLNQGLADYGVYEVDIIPVKKEYMENLRKQDYLYSLLSKATNGKEELSIRGDILGYANACTEPEKVLELLTSNQTKIISLTVTEKGYFYDEKTHGLDKSAMPVVNDLKSKEWPKTVVGFLAKALKVRFEENIPVTILSCDNIPVNGQVLKSVLLDFIEEKYPEILSWVEKEINFPCCMVDRITPSPSQADLDEVSDKYHIIDNCGVHCEDFIQWVIEDTGNPYLQNFEKAGALLVKDVKPYELMKIRLLNGSHSALSYPAYLMGIRRVDEAIKNPLIHSFIRDHYMQEITKSLPIIPNFDFDQYKDKLVSRFANANIADQITRLASDGSKKIGNAIVRPLLELKDKDSLILALALWARYLEGIDEQGNPIVIDDPMKDQLSEAQKDDKEFLKLIGIEDNKVLNTFTEYRTMINNFGTKKTLEIFIKK